ncbi:Rrf2 family transcriptional regulator [Alkalilimnicola ehrlichii]|uniref:Rrf2 family transcriptional regulator n=1 Tax=Alkalilimnicola ehrlichii TaxID=351052 RepID=A0A3E0WWV8_9GAMM|nr:Rrf2 family transcriptional regulator [Alkalilimnicola ehrlichii]RFA29908.1 Rrf2 family transcriptional regulator [Alkalilimnicola ehrlichii]RFA36496.1 Rrf2 family transcriptional regulator [Alkalilimnicola ehrlichii]
MHITRYTDYSLRVLIFVALKGEQLSTIREIADSYGISKNHLMKVVHELNRKGYLGTVRGKNGGVRLGRAPETINIGELVRATEQDLTLVECFGPDNACVITPSCRLKNVLAEALEAFFSVLDRYTLADVLIADERAPLVQLLRMDWPRSRTSQEEV